MPDGMPPLVTGFEDDEETQLERLARLIYSRRVGILPADLDTWFDVHPSELDELDRIMDSLVRPSHLSGGVRCFDVTPSPDGEIVVRGQRVAVVRFYTFNLVPNRKRHTIAPWVFFGQR